MSDAGHCPVYITIRGRAIRNGVDKIEDVKTPEFNKPQQSSISCLHLIETEAIENRHFGD